MGKSQSRLGFKSRFEHIWRFGSNYRDSIPKIAVWFEIWFEFFGDSILKRFKSGLILAACLPTQNEMHESLEQFCFGCSLAPKLHRVSWLIDIVSTVSLQNISHVIRPKIRKQNIIVIREICFWLPPFCKQNLLYIQPRWQLRRTYFFNHYNVLF